MVGIVSDVAAVVVGIGCLVVAFVVVVFLRFLAHASVLKDDLHDCLAGRPWFRHSWTTSSDVKSGQHVVHGQQS